MVSSSWPSLSVLQASKQWKTDLLFIYFHTWCVENLVLFCLHSGPLLQQGITVALDWYQLMKEGTSVWANGLWAHSVSVCCWWRCDWSLWELPESCPECHEEQIQHVQWPAMVSLIRSCTSERSADRPSMSDITELLDRIHWVYKNRSTLSIFCTYMQL